MMEKEVAELFSRSRDHDEMIAALRQEQALQGQSIDSLNATIDRMSRDQAAQHGELIAEVRNVSAQVGDISRDHLINQGKATITKWLVPVLITSVGVLVAVLAFIQANGGAA